MKTTQRAAFELVLAAAIWGFGFVATIWGLKEFSPVGLMISRYFWALSIGELLRFFLSSARPFHSKKDFTLSIVAGLLMAGFILPQTIGLLSTTATNSGFLTVLYVVFVPILGRILLRQKHTVSVYLQAVVALFGAWLMMGGQWIEIKSGDLWTLMCAVFAAIHILYIGQISDKIENSYRFNSYQSFWCLIGLLFVIPTETHFSIKATEWKSLFGLFFLALGSSVFGFAVQIRAQKVLADTTAAQFFLLESPFALLFGVLLLGERISPIQIGGAALILIASIIAIRSDRKL